MKEMRVLVLITYCISEVNRIRLSKEVLCRKQHETEKDLHDENGFERRKMFQRLDITVDHEWYKS